MKQVNPKFVLLSALCAAFMFVSCGSDAAEEFVDWGSDSRGTLEIVNTSNTDIVLFLGDRPTDSGILGGVRAGTTKNVNICAHPQITDCAAGGWVIIQGIDRSLFNDNFTNLTTITKIDFHAFATYKGDTKYRITIDRDYVGDKAVRLVNRGKVGMELRKNSPEGEKVAYLPALAVEQMLYTQTTDAITLFPYYVLYNTSTRSVTTLKATEMTQSVMATPRPASNPQGIQTAFFPNDETDSWEKIVGTLKSPVAYITVDNGVINQGIYFTNAGGTRYYSQNGYNAIGSGEQLVFEVEAADAVYAKDEDDKDTDEITGGGITKNLIMQVYNGVVNVPVLFEGETTQPRLYNGYDYTISVSGSGATSEGYKATITRGAKRDLSGQLESI